MTKFGAALAAVLVLCCCATVVSAATACAAGNVCKTTTEIDEPGFEIEECQAKQHVHWNLQLKNNFAVNSNYATLSLNPCSASGMVCQDNGETCNSNPPCPSGGCDVTDAAIVKRLAPPVRSGQYSFKIQPPLPVSGSPPGLGWVVFFGLRNALTDQSVNILFNSSTYEGFNCPTVVRFSTRNLGNSNVNGLSWHYSKPGCNSPSLEYLPFDPWATASLTTPVFHTFGFTLDATTNGGTVKYWAKESGGDCTASGEYTLDSTWNTLNDYQVYALIRLSDKPSGSYTTESAKSLIYQMCYPSAGS